MKKSCLPLILCLFLWSCGDGVVPNQCLLGGKVEHVVEDVSGYFSFNEDLDHYTIRHHVPGTIDSFWTGVLCLSSLELLELPDEGEVVFSGEFKDDQERFNPSVQIGGEKFYYLDLISIESEQTEGENN